jgi:glycerol-3-phosphate dehydrogenase subunit B
MKEDQIKTFELAVIGAGIAGIASSVFASYRGIDTIMIGRSSGLDFASGCLDLLGSEPLSGKNDFSNPWEGIDVLLNVNPFHPYRNLSKDSIMSAFNEFSGFMSCAGLPLSGQSRKNSFIITPAGTLKKSFFIPNSMYEGFCAVNEKKKILIISIKGLKGFSGIQICQNLKKYGIDCTTREIEFPGIKINNDLNCQQMAWDIEMGKAFESFASKIKTAVKNENAIGIPAVLGIYQSENLRAKLESKLNLPVFEIPTFSPSVQGLRMKEKLTQKLKENGVNINLNSKINSIQKDKNNDFIFSIENNFHKKTIIAKNLIIATGRFFGGGLQAEKRKVFEPLLDVYIEQPKSGKELFESDFFAKSGHLINRCGIKTDRYFRPLNSINQVFDENLFSAGSILSDQDWKREKSGSGIGIVSSYVAVSALSRSKKNEDGSCLFSENKENAA